MTAARRKYPKRGVVDGMAWSIWEHVAASHGADKDVVPDAAYQAADDLVLMYQKANCVDSMDDLAKEMHEKPTEDLGYRLAKHALKAEYEGTLVSVISPVLEVTYDGSTLVWDGHLDLAWEGSEGIRYGQRKNPTSKKAAPTGMKNNPCSCHPNPTSHWTKSEVQSLLFDKAMFTEAKAKAWAKEHGYLYGSVDTTGSYHRLRQEAPQGGPCRTVEFTAGVKAIVCATGRGLPPGVPSGR